MRCYSFAVRRSGTHLIRCPRADPGEPASVIGGAPVCMGAGVCACAGDGGRMPGQKRGTPWVVAHLARPPTTAHLITPMHAEHACGHTRVCVPALRPWWARHTRIVCVRWRDGRLHSLPPTLPAPHHPIHPHPPLRPCARAHPRATCMGGGCGAPCVCAQTPRWHQDVPAALWPNG